MPLLKVDSRTAWNNIHKDKGGWRDERLSPIAAPEFFPSFKIEPGSKIFTIGSCFARNIEIHLVKAGFDNPSLRILQGRTFVLNKYNPFSMLQEVKWAMGLERRPTLDERLIRVPGKGCCDCHLHWVTLNSEEEAKDIISNSESVFSEIFDSKVFIITLGLIEVWRDNLTGTVINEPLNVIRHFGAYPEIREQFIERFTFEVLTYEETLESTKELLTLLMQASPNCNIILTVSPVPLGGSFTTQDVMVANSYSKSALRTVAETICRTFEKVDYFPSYESVMLTERTIAWDPDNIHVTDAVVSFNVQRMLTKYTDLSKTSI